MALTGHAKTDYQREYMRRRCACAKAAVPPYPRRSLRPAPVLWSNQQAVVDMLEAGPPQDTRHPQGQPVGLATAELVLCDFGCAKRGEKVGVWLPNGVLVRRVSKLMPAPMVAAGDLDGNQTVDTIRFTGGGYILLLHAGSASSFLAGGL